MATIESYADFSQLIETNTQESNDKVCHALKELVDVQRKSIYSFKSHEGETLLHAACRYKNPTILTFLLTSLSTRIHPNIDNFRGSYALIYAVISDSLECVKILLEHKVHPRLRSGFSGEFPEDTAESDEIAILIYEAGANLLPITKNETAAPLVMTDWATLPVMYAYRKYMWYKMDLNYYYGTMTQGVDLHPDVEKIMSTPGKTKDENFLVLADACDKLWDEFYEKSTKARIENQPRRISTSSVDNICLYCEVKKGEELLRCTRCKQVWFCGVDCQRAANKIHKLDCKAL